MGYQRVMGYRVDFPANQAGHGIRILWGMREYGLSELWVKRELTVLQILVEIWA